jgi:hypothetical protein
MRSMRSYFRIWMRAGPGLLGGGKGWEVTKASSGLALVPGFPGLVPDQDGQVVRVVGVEHGG